MSNFWKKSVLFVILLAFPTNSISAQGFESGNWKVSGYRSGFDGVLFSLSPGPVSCGGGSNYGEHIRIGDTAKNRDAMIAALMSAFASGDTVTGIWFSNHGPCDDAVVLELTMVRLKAR